MIYVCKFFSLKGYIDLVIVNGYIDCKIKYFMSLNFIVGLW